MTATTRQYTIDEFIQYAATHGRRELIRREIRDLSLSGERHGEVTGLLHAIIGHYVVEHRLGKVFTAETGYRFDEDGKATVRAPDFAFKSLAWAKGPSNISFGRIPPEFVVEVLSRRTGRRKSPKK